MQQSDSSYQIGPNVAKWTSLSRWKKPLLVVFHLHVIMTYGLAIIAMNQPPRPDAPKNPAMEPYGQWRFLTFNDVVLQFVMYILCLVTHFVPRLTKLRDFLFTTLAFPVGMFVVFTFWSVWHIAGRESILPVAIGCPDWLNHIMHTIMGPINLVQLVVVEHNFLSDSKAIACLLAYLMTYNSYLLLIRYRTGEFVYLFMNKMNSWQIALFMMGGVVFAALLYKGGRFLHDYVHRHNCDDDDDDDGHLDTREIIERTDYRPSANTNTKSTEPKGSNSNGLTLSIIENN